LPIYSRIEKINFKNSPRTFKKSNKKLKKKETASNKTVAKRTFIIV